MASRPFPIARYLVPEPSFEPPEGHTAIQSVIVTGLPHAIPLTGDLRLMLVLPTGFAVQWRDTQASTVISSAAAASEPALPFRLLLQRGSRTVAALPLVRGLTQLGEESGAEGRVAIEVNVASWTFHAGIVVGPGDYGSRVALSWREVGQALDHYSTPPPNPHLIPRLPPEKKTESSVGVFKERFKYPWAVSSKELSRTRYAKKKASYREVIR